MTTQQPHKCPKCERSMIRKPTGHVYDTYPAYYSMNWWCQCGYQETAGCLTEEDLLKEQQDKLNDKSNAS